MAKKEETVRKDFGDLLHKLGNKKFNVPTQRVVPIHKENIKNPDTYKLSLRMYVREFENLLRFINYMIIDKKNLNFNMSNAISTGIHLLTNNETISKGMPKVKLAVGRKDQTTSEAIKGTTVTVPLHDMNLLNDYIYHQMLVERNTKYSRVDLMSDIIGALKKEYPEAI
ncbi:hypothetical protein SD427_19015 (plasmid) [Chryseobacterium sp. JJR-5R]|uniref:hypothetical protein n=1 Tax=Chryseobacterium sp. JJR-5R TaxID=3093923 RepID=UPI002A7567DE|nr:hypothetical protein [Chryseobacterium sp. JJR-5R]WPO84621.1 hypothetical protein SD427_19015 [Chryseobacterium sp. JJR-5R]